MENRKIITSAFILLSALVWFLSRSSIQYLYTAFYQIRRLKWLAPAREGLPLVLAILTFVILIKHPKVTPFFDEVVSELKKVTWPSRSDVVKSTIVVIICIFLASLILASFDLVWGKLVGFLLNA